jgi:hypothetical protein
MPKNDASSFTLVKILLKELEQTKSQRNIFITSDGMLSWLSGYPFLDTRNRWGNCQFYSFFTLQDLVNSLCWRNRERGGVGWGDGRTNGPSRTRKKGRRLQDRIM